MGNTQHRVCIAIPLIIWEAVAVVEVRNAESSRGWRDVLRRRNVRIRCLPGVGDVRESRSQGSDDWLGDTGAGGAIH